MIKNPRNPRYMNLEGSLIDITVTHERLGEINFTATLNDPEERGRVLYTAALQGDFGPIAPYVPTIIPKSVLDAKINADADRAIADMMPEAVRTLMAWSIKQANGADKTSLQTVLSKIDAEYAKKK